MAKRKKDKEEGLIWIPAALIIGTVAVIGTGLYFLFGKPSPPPGAVTLAGRVIDALNGTPLENVSVTANGIGVATTNFEGIYTFDVSPGTYTLRYAKQNYVAAERTVTVTVPEQLSDTPLIPIPSPPPPGLPIEITNAKTADQAGNIKSSFGRGETVVLSATYKNVGNASQPARLIVQVMDSNLFPLPPGIVDITLSPGQETTPTYSIKLSPSAVTGIYVTEFTAMKDTTLISPIIRFYFEVTR